MYFSHNDETNCNKNFVIKNIHSDFCEKINLICKPLQMFDLTYFHYIRTYENHSRISLSNNRPWVEYYYDKQYYLNPAIDKHFSYSTYSRLSWASFEHTIIFSNLREKFDIGNGITLIRKFHKCTDFYYFGTSADNKKIFDFYINNIKLLERFIIYFMDAASKIIKNANEHRIVIPDTKITLAQLKNNDINNIEESFINSTPIKKIRINDGSSEMILSSRQVDCIAGLILGKNAKHISKDLNLSIRTIENYIYNLKIKFNCYSKTDLIQKLKPFINSGANCFIKDS